MDSRWVLDVKEELAVGAYGVIYRCLNQEKKEMALKCIKLRRRGIPCLMEASIMTSIIHPNLNHSLHVNIVEDNLCLVQEMALSDLCHHTREYQGSLSPLPSKDKVYEWSLSLVRALQCLHHHKIIHADVKASNILLYRDGSIRLNDFTLSTKVWIEGSLFYHDVCTSTHRPPEAIRREGWSYPLDLWSLGCTLFEIAYGRLLFPYQGGAGIKSEEKAKRELACLSAFEEVRPTLLSSIESSKGLDVTSGTPSLGMDIKASYAHLPEAFYEPERREFNLLLLKLLHPDPKLRLTLAQVAQDPYFPHGIPPIEHKVNKIPIIITPKKQASFNAIVNRFIPSITSQYREKALTLGGMIYGQCLELSIKEESKCIACLWLAIKLVDPRPELLNVPLVDLYPTERRICRYLGFRLPIL